MTAPRQILLESRNGVATVTLNRPSVRNAFDDALVSELGSSFTRLGHDASVRAIVLAGAGSVFCAGVDLGWMARSEPGSDSQQRQDADQIQRMLRAIDECPCPVIARVQGAAYGGGVGLLAACDIGVVAEDAVFALREVRVGLIPAVIAPFLLQKLGGSQLRRFCLTGEPFSAQVAKSIGLAHEVVAAKDLDSAVRDFTAHLLQAGPEAVRAAKHLFRQISTVPAEERWRLCREANARIRDTEEAREGLRAFLEKRPPAWTREPRTEGSD